MVDKQDVLQPMTVLLNLLKQVIIGNVKKKNTMTANFVIRRKQKVGMIMKYHGGGVIRFSLFCDSAAKKNENAPKKRH